MKVSKLFTIDVEIAERLKSSGNSSALINKLLKEYYEIRSDKHGIFEEKRAIFEDLKKKMRQTRKEYTIISTLEAFKLDRFSIRWLKAQDQEPSILSIREYVRGRELNAQSENFLKAWRLLKEHGNLFEGI